MSLETIFDAILKGDMNTAKADVSAALDAGVPAGDILNKGCIAAMQQVGQLFEEGEVFVPEMLVSARAMQGAMELLRPHLVDGEIVSAGKVVMGTVSGDLHDIGKNLVCMMMEGAGFDVIDLGTDVDPDKFVAAIKEHNPDLIGMSALLTTTMSSMEKTIKLLEEAGVRDQVKIMIGGAPVTSDFAEKIGAEGYAPDASSATRIAKQLIG